MVKLFGVQLGRAVSKVWAYCVTIENNWILLSSWWMLMVFLILHTPTYDMFTRRPGFILHILAESRFKSEIKIIIVHANSSDVCWNC